MMRRSLILIWVLCGCTTAADVTVHDLDGAEVRPLAASSERKAMALIFYLLDCPICNAMAPEIERIRSDYAKRGAEVMLVVVNKTATPEKIRQHCKDFGLNCRVLLDPELKLASELKVTRTPEAVALDAEGKVQYRGRINDLYVTLGKKRDQPRQHDLRAALDAIVSGKAPAVTQTEAIGCNLPETAADSKKKE